jgi:hypothetical protein
MLAVLELAAGQDLRRSAVVGAAVHQQTVSATDDDRGGYCRAAGGIRHVSACPSQKGTFRNVRETIGNHASAPCTVSFPGASTK